MKKGKGIVVFLFFILIAVAAAGAYAYIATDLFKTPEQLFKKYFFGNITQITDMNLQPFDEISERTDNETAEISFDVTYDETSIDEDSAINNINIKLKTDIPNKNEELELVVKQNDEIYFEGSIVSTNETYGIKVPDLYEKYIAVENRDLKKIAETFELSESYIETIPDKITSSSITFTDEEQDKIDELYNKYIDKIFEQLDENAYMVEKDINVSVNDETLVANRYTLTTTNKQLYTILTNTFSEILNDEEVLTLLKGKVEDSYIEELRTKYNESLDDNSADDLEESSIKIAVYAANGKTVKTEFIEDESTVEFSINNKENESIITMVSTSYDDFSEAEITTTNIIRNSYVNGVGELSYEVKNVYDGQEEEEYQKVTIKTKKVNDNNITGSFNFDGDDFEEISEFLTIKLGFKFGSAEVTTINEDNSVIINDYTEEDYQNLLTDIMQTTMTTVYEKPNSLVATIYNYLFLPAEDNYTYEDNDYSYNYEDDNNDYYLNLEEYDDLHNTTVAIDTESIKLDIDTEITNGLQECLDNYQNELLYNSEANLGDFLTIENVQTYCDDNYVLELLDGTTIKCTIENNGETLVYYALMNIDGDTLTVTEVEVITEDEYYNR